MFFVPHWVLPGSTRSGEDAYRCSTVVIRAAISVRKVPGYDVDSLTISAGLFTERLINSLAACTKDKSGFRASSSGVGTAITITSHPSNEVASVLAL